MTQLFSIKPLEWSVVFEAGGVVEYAAYTCFGRLLVVTYGGICKWRLDSGESWPCDSIDDGKAKAEAYYRERLLSALHPESPPDDPA